ncbi:MAG: four helix bundle protein [Saprospiraceae bacterium]
MRENIIKDKSYQFSLQIIQTYLKLNSQKEYVLSKQLLRAGTSIGANIEEGVAGQSKKDFIAKLQISYKESKETHYWIRLLKDSNLLDASISDKLITDLDEIIRILRAILIKSKS